jgi:PLP dependent protein
VRHFGENRVQDAARKFAVPLPDDAELHMIGHLQSNKAGVAAQLFDIVESVDRDSLISELGKQAAKQIKPLPVLLQVNIAGEAQKAGCEPEEAESLLRALQDSSHLELRGLMTIAPLVDDPGDVRPVFRGLRVLRDRLRQKCPDVSLDVLSMGMTNDFQVAIEEGSTLVRVGRAIFSGN